MTRDQYHAKVKTFDQDRINAMIDRIPSNVNRAGRHYRKLVKEIYATQQLNQRN
jgi:hypothetical protein